MCFNTALTPSMYCQCQDINEYRLCTAHYPCGNLAVRLFIVSGFEANVW